MGLCRGTSWGEGTRSGRRKNGPACWEAVCSAAGQSFSSATAPAGRRAALGRPELRGLGGAGPDAADGDAQSPAPQDAGLALRHRLLPAVHLHADAKSCFLALRGGSADTFAALGWKKKREA